MFVKINLHFTDREEGKSFEFDDLEEAAYFMGIMQHGCRIGGTIYMLKDHYFNLDEGQVVDAFFCTDAEFEAEIEAEREKTLSRCPNVGNALRPPFDFGNGGGGFN